MCTFVICLVIIMFAVAVVLDKALVSYCDIVDPIDTIVNFCATKCVPLSASPFYVCILLLNGSEGFRSIHYWMIIYSA